jgi:hypothetical protein
MNLFDRFTLENWYFEVIFRGAPMSLCFTRMTHKGKRSAAFSARSPELKHARRYGDGDLSVAEDGRRVQFGGGYVAETESGCRVRVHEPGLELELAFSSPNAPYLPGKNGVLYQSKSLLHEEVFRWILPFPVASVEGRVNGEDVQTVGYHDFLETNVPPARFPFVGVHKGRFYPDPQSIVSFIDLRFREDLRLPPETFAVYARLGAEPIESGHTLVIRERLVDDIPVQGTAIMGLHGKELKFPFEHAAEVVRLRASEFLPLEEAAARRLLGPRSGNLTLAQFVSVTQAGDAIIHGMHDLVF